jgi:hypothetical protein
MTTMTVIYNGGKNTKEWRIRKSTKKSSRSSTCYQWKIIFSFHGWWVSISSIVVLKVNNHNHGVNSNDNHHHQQQQEEDVNNISMKVVGYYYYGSSLILECYLVFISSTIYVCDEYDLSFDRINQSTRRNIIWYRSNGGEVLCTTLSIWIWTILAVLASFMIILQHYYQGHSTFTKMTIITRRQSSFRGGYYVVDTIDIIIITLDYILTATTIITIWSIIMHQSTSNKSPPTICGFNHIIVFCILSPYSDLPSAQHNCHHVSIIAIFQMHSNDKIFPYFTKFNPSN